jgi:hypothetical protein
MGLPGAAEAVAEVAFAAGAPSATLFAASVDALGDGEAANTCAGAGAVAPARAKSKICIATPFVA